MGTASGAALVGRAEELERISACAQAVGRGTGALVLLDGDAGTGKTRLLSEIVRAPFLPRGFATAVAGALDYARAPYAPIRDLLTALDKRFPKVLQANRVLAADLQPVLDFRPASENAEDPAQQRRLLDAIVQAVSLYAAQSPVMLALEDVHWIDSASADVLVHLSRAIPAMRALLLVSFRPTEAREDERAQHLLAQLSRNATLSLSLKPLSFSDAMILVDDAAPALAMDLRRNICKLADGNPLLLIEFAKVASENPDALNGSLPLSLKALVAERLARFDAGDVDVLRVAAVMGEFDPRMLSEIASLEEPNVIATLRKARDASIVGEQRTKGAPFVFRHALIRHAITDDLLAFEAEQLHARIAQRLEREEATPGLHSRLAHHFHHAGMLDKSRRYNERAGGEALAVFAYSDAVLLFERAIGGRLLDESTQSLYARLAEAYTGAQRPSDAAHVSEKLFEFALARKDQEAIADIGFSYARQLYHMLDDDGSIAVIERACAAVDRETHPVQAFNMLATRAWYLAHLQRTREAQAALLEAEPLRRHGDGPGLVRYYEAHAVKKVHAGEGLGYRDDLEMALAVAEKIGAAFLVNRINTAMAISMASTLDDMEFVDTLSRKFVAVAEHLPITATSNTMPIAAWSAFLRGELNLAKTLLARVLPLAEDAPLLSFSIACAGIPVALHTNDPLLLRRCARPRLLEHAFSSNTSNVFGPVGASVAAQLRVQNRLDEARTLVNQAVRRLKDAANNITLMMEVARCGASESHDRALAMLAELKDRSRSANAAWHFLIASASSGEERKKNAILAAQGFHSIQWRVYEAECLEFAGSTDEALEIYRQCGCSVAVERLEGAKAVRRNAGLSKREFEVARLVAQGRSNRSIAESLSLSERTVENHIASIFAKLSLRSRAEIAAYIAREAEQQRANF